MTTFVFSGQGVQVRGMGSTLFDRYDGLTRQADQILGYSVKELCLEDRENRLNFTEYTQPAVYVVNTFYYLQFVERGCRPDYLAGHSLGEYNALFAAGVFDFVTGLRIVQKRGALMGQETKGSMAAVIGLDAEKVQDIINRNAKGRIWIANYNSPTQVVIAGEQRAVAGTEEILKANEALHVIPLKVSGAFHTPMMAAAQEALSAFLQPLRLQSPQIPVVANISALPYQPQKVKKNLVQQMTGAVRWSESIEYLISQGEMDFVELGPAKVLTKLIGQIQESRSPKSFYSLTSVSNAHKVSSCLDNAKEETNDRKGSHSPANVHAENSSGYTSSITPQSLGDSSFKTDYGLKYAYLSGGMYRGIASRDLVIRMGKAGMMGFFGTGGLSTNQIEDDLLYIRKALGDCCTYGMNFLHNPMDLSREEALVDLFLRHGVQTIEASAFTQITPALVRYRLHGLPQDDGNKAMPCHRIIAKVSRPEVAALFMMPPPEKILRKLLAEGKIVERQVALARRVPLADDICVEADSGGHTDQGVAYVLFPAMICLRDEMMQKYGYTRKIHIGAAGGIGTPEAASAAFILGADFILTGSINQCTVEAGTSAAVKSMLQQVNVQDTDYAPAGDMFEMGAKVQVMRRGVFFASRANKLYDIYRNCNCVEDIDPKTRRQLEQKYFSKTFEEIWEETCSFFRDRPDEIEKAIRNPKYKLGLVLRWYFHYSTQLAIDGDEHHKVNFQVHCGPALGAFNQWVKNTELKDWRNRHVDDIARRIMSGTAEVLNLRFSQFGAT